jgi:hypothetical protein
MRFHGSKYHAHQCEKIAVPRQVFPSTNTFGICFGLFQGKMARVFSLK